MYVKLVQGLSVTSGDTPWVSVTLLVELSPSVHL